MRRSSRRKTLICCGATSLIVFATFYSSLEVNNSKSKRNKPSWKWDEKTSASHDTHLISSKGTPSLKWMTSFHASKNITNHKTRVFIFFGTRPEIIKMAPVIQTFVTSNHFNIITVFTGQHPDLINPFLDIFEIKVDIWFENILQKNQSITDLISKIMLHSKKLVLQESDIWMVQGDTSTAFAIATVAFHHGLRIAHVEAGLRTFNMYSPFPEEFNRKTISSIATFHFAPTQNNKNNLLKEGIPEEYIFVTGNTVIDAVKYLEEHNKTKAPSPLVDVKLDEHILVLITLHRRENMEMMLKLYLAIGKIQCSKCLFIVPVHPNPSAEKAARDMCETDPKRFLCVPPLAYEEVHWIMMKSQFILTDSGGLQEEATWYHVPTLVLRESTERMEAANVGAAALVGTNLKLLETKVLLLMDMSSHLWKTMSKPSFPFGYGNASKQILKILISYEYSPLKNILLNNKGHQAKTEPEDLRIKHFHPVTIGVVLQVFKRNSLKLQLDSIVNQTLLPTTVIVLQNGYHVDVSKVITDFRKTNPEIEIQHIASSKNLRFHGRFYIAYMMQETYVSIWDDDLIPKSQWLEYCVKYSKSNGNALVTANGITFSNIFPHKESNWSLVVGKSDFGGHTWTLPREFLKYYLEMKMPTRYTGEDILLAYALQQHGIDTMSPEHEGENAAPDPPSITADKNASWKKNQNPRHLLFCKLLKDGFSTIKCKNCKDQRILNECIKHFTTKALVAEQKAVLEDRRDNNSLVWSGVHRKE